MKPRIEVSGVRSSCDTFARNSVLVRLARLSSSTTCVSSNVRSATADSSASWLRSRRAIAWVRPTAVAVIVANPRRSSGPGLDDARVAGAGGDKEKAPHIVADRDRRTRDRRDTQRLGERDRNVDRVERRDEHCRATLEAALDDAQLGSWVERQEPSLLVARQAFDRGELHALVGLGPASDGGQTGPGPRPDRRDQGPGHLVRVGQRCQPLAHREQRGRHPGLTREVLARRQELDREPCLRRQRTSEFPILGIDRVGVVEEHVQDPCHGPPRRDRERQAAPGAVRSDALAERLRASVVRAQLVAGEASLEDVRSEGLAERGRAIRPRPVRGEDRGHAGRVAEHHGDI